MRMLNLSLSTICRWGVCLWVITALPAAAVPPAYVGRLGNAEEPALRPYKWAWHGVKAFVFQTQDQLVRGNMEFPVLGTVKGFRGVRWGTVELLESTARGMVFAPLPERGTQAWKKLQPWNRTIEDELFLKNSCDLAFSWWFFPALKALDYVHVDNPETVDTKLKEAAQVRGERDKAYHERNQSRHPENTVSESSRRRAREEYVGYRLPQPSTKTVADVPVMRKRP